MRDKLKQDLLTLKSIWTAFILSAGLFAVVLMTTELGASDDVFLPMVISMIAFVEVPILFIMRYQFLGSLALFEPNDLRVDERTETDALIEPVRAASERYKLASWINFSIAESILIMGFTSSFLSGSLAWYAGAVIVYIALMVLIRPTLAGVMCTLTGPQRQGLREALAQAP